MRRAWTVCLIASLFFFYEFIQMNMMNAVSTPLMQEFHLNASHFAEMASLYFLANVIFLFFAGQLLDRFSIQRIILIALGICILGTLLFSFVHTIEWTVFCRFLTGIGSAFCFLSVIRLATRWFPANRLALVTGVIVTMAMLGGMIAQTPMMLLVKALGWRHALQVDAALGVFVFLLITLFVKDYPPNAEQQHAIELNQIHQMGYFKSMKLAFLKIQNWLGGIYTCLMNLPVSILGGLLGVVFLNKVHGISELQASEITSMLFLGTIIGSPIVGWLSDRIRLRRLPMKVGAIISLGFIFIIMFVPHLSYFSLITLFLLLGITTSTQIIGYPTVAENSLPAITAMSVSVVNITTQGGQFVFQQLFGKLIDWHANTTVYQASDFSWAMWIFPLGFVLAFLAVSCLKETFCLPRSSRGMTRERESTS